MLEVDATASNLVIELCAANPHNRQCFIHPYKNGRK